MDHTIFLLCLAHIRRDTISVSTILLHFQKIRLNKMYITKERRLKKTFISHLQMIVIR